MKAVYVSGTRADYSLMRRTLIVLNKEIDLTIIVTSMHLSPAFGSTVREIEADGLKIKKVDMLLDNDTIGAMVKSLGIGIYGITQAIEEIKPDIILVEGDKGESLAAAIVGAHFNIPIIHHGGGDVSGSIDNKIRYAISTFADYHLVGNKVSFQRLIDSNITKDRIFIVGEPGLDDIYLGDFTQTEELIKKYGVDQTTPLIILAQHPNTEEVKDVEKQITETLEAIEELEIQTIAIYSNADSGGRKINEYLEQYSKKFSFLQVVKHLNRQEFVGLLNLCDLMVGNSSTGLVELPSFYKPFVCVGTRQKNRLRAENTIDVPYDRKSIIEGIKKALYDQEFRKKLQNITNPYGDGKASIRIKEIIMTILNR